MDCIACDACPETALEVTQETWQGDTWGGSTYTFGQNAAGCTCHNTFSAPAGKYRISIPVFATAADATNNTSASIVAYDFDLPFPGDSVTVPITP